MLCLLLLAPQIAQRVDILVDPRPLLTRDELSGWRSQGLRPRRPGPPIDDVKSPIFINGASAYRLPISGMAKRSHINVECPLKQHRRSLRETNGSHRRM